VVIYNRSIVVTAAERIEEQVQTFSLLKNYPNPFNPSTTILFSVPVRDVTTVKVYSILGSEVAHVFDGDTEPGTQYRVQYDASSLAGGIYIVHLRSGGISKVMKMVLLK
jgi:hypothetical protein